MTKPIGFDQKVLLHHLDYTARQSRKHSKKDMHTILDGYLREDIAGAKSRKNAITMLMKIWYNVPDDVQELREEVLNEFNDFTKEERLFAHWCMTIIAYPFFKDVINEFGRLFQLQDEVASTVIGKRMKESYGDRRRVEVATSAVLTSLRSWEVITPKKYRSYAKGKKAIVSNSLLHALMFQTLFYAFEIDSFYLDTISNHPLFFPFFCEFQLFELREKENEFAFHYQGMDHIIVERS